MKRRWAWCRLGSLGLTVIALGLIVASRWLAWYEWTVGDALQRSGLGGPRLPRDLFPAFQDADPMVPQTEYAFGSWQGQDVIPTGMGVYVILLMVSGALGWATLARVAPSRTTLEIAYLCFSVGILVWLGVLPLWWFWLLFRSGLIGPSLPSSEVLVILLDVAFVRLVLRGPLTLLASLLLSIASFVWGRVCPSSEPSSTVTRQA